MMQQPVGQLGDDGMPVQWQTLLESMPDGIALVDDRGCIVAANGQAECLFGYDAGELVNRGIETLLPERFRAQHVTHRSGYIQQPRVRAMGSGLDLQGLRRDGTEFPVEISLSAVTVADRRCVLCAIRDVSERRRIEQALHDKNEELARANAAKDRFLASLSHELRTPLNAVIGFTGTLLMKLPGPLNDEQTRQLKLVQHSGRHLLAVINDLLDVARIAAGKTEVKWGELDLRVLVQDVAQTLMPQAQQRGLAQRVELPDSPAPTLTDRRLVNQILLNVLGNAIKFTDAGEVSIVLMPAAGSEPPAWNIRVTDTGPGISAADQARLFEPFSRAQNAATRAREGSGLGLHLSRQLAELLGGTLSLESRVGAGTTLTLHLPARR